MASQIIREWSGIQQFPGATQAKLVELLGKLKQEDVASLTILVTGKGGVGKSSNVNSVIGERVVAVSAFQFMGLKLQLGRHLNQKQKMEEYQLRRNAITIISAWGCWDNRACRRRIFSFIEKLVGFLYLNNKV